MRKLSDGWWDYGFVKVKAKLSQWWIGGIQVVQLLLNLCINEMCGQIHTLEFYPQRKSPGTSWIGNRRLGGPDTVCIFWSTDTSLTPAGKWNTFPWTSSICVYNIQITTITKNARSPNKMHFENMYTPVYNRSYHYCCTKDLVCWQFWTSSTLVSSRAQLSCICV